ncbi:hypothetical protein MKX03_002898 [Papaver bracteatum]|nr:hypothetical protein MKX03_002898 [Papaver bracteatum]
MEQNHQFTSSNGSGVPPPPPEPLMYKNHLITYTQRSAIPLPVYETVNLGYRCTVHVNGVAYTTADTFRNPKDAEQEASKLALESIAKKIKEESIAIINQDPVSCKSILNEYAVKMNLPIPMYTTATRASSHLHLLFRKDAERLAARMAIHSIIALIPVHACLNIQYNVLSILQVLLVQGLVFQRLSYPKSRLSNVSRMLEESQTIQDSHTAMVATPGTFVEGVTSTPPPSEYKKHKVENSCETDAGPIRNMAHLLDQPVSVSEHCGASQTIQDTNLVAVTIPDSNCGGSSMKGKEIPNSSFSQTPLKLTHYLYKSILNEYAVKMNHPVPAYTTTQAEPHSFFISSLVFDGKTYTGPAARNKKDAERLAARMVIHSVTGTSDPGTCLSEIMKFKSRLSNAPRKPESESVRATPPPSHEMKKPKEELVQ